MTDLTDLAARETEIAEKTKVITHLTQTLSHTRSCLEIARTALQSIADDGKESHARCREIASEALGRI
jgi:hypothetical protein